jgi:hypothetical protein
MGAVISPVLPLTVPPNLQVLSASCVLSSSCASPAFTSSAMSLPMATFRRSLSLLPLFASLAFSQTCYISAGVAAASFVVPCGTGTVACCQLGDICLGDSACYNAATGVTYLYGCSDSSYTNAVCPWKCGPDFGGQFLAHSNCADVNSKCAIRWN